MKKSYLSYLTDKELEEILNKMGFELVQLHDRNGNPLPKIERDTEEQEHFIFVRCKKTKSNSVEEELYPLFSQTSAGKNLIMMTSFLKNRFMDDAGFLTITDFEFNQYFSDDTLANKPTNENAHTFAKLFSQKLFQKSELLGKSYVKAYNANVKKFNKQLEKDKKQNQEKDQSME